MSKKMVLRESDDFFRVTVTDPVSGDVQTKDIVPAVADTITSADWV